MDTYSNNNNLCVLKVKVKCGKKEHEDDPCGCYNKDCKILFKDHEQLAEYRDNRDELIRIIANNGLTDPDYIRDVQPVRLLDVNENEWRERMNDHRPNGLTWDTASTEDRMKFIAKFLNQHPYRTQVSDAIYPCF